MKYLRQFMLLLILYFIGNLIQTALHIPIPGSVLGLLLLFLGLYFKWISLGRIEEIGEFLLNHMAFLFVPAGVGLMAAFSLIEGKWMALLCIVLVSTLVVWIVTAYTVVLLRRLIS